jgi:SAM-dependent methyltransferase
MDFLLLLSNVLKIVMEEDDQLKRFLALWEEALDKTSWHKLIVSMLLGKDAPNKIVLTPVIVKGEAGVKMVKEFPTRHETVTMNKDASRAWLADLLIHFSARDVYLFDGFNQYQLKGSKKGKWRLMERANIVNKEVALAHNRQKYYLIEEDAPFLNVLGLSSSNGRILAPAQKKFRQINRFLEILLPTLSSLKKSDLKIADLGSGHGYLTFALYDYLSTQAGINANVEGVELRPDLVRQCNEAAAQLGFSGLHFTEGDILHYRPSSLDVCIALHACDTATDRAILAGLEAGASIIVLAPCCHKQVRQAMEIPDALKSLLRHGVFMERTAEMLTDAIRVLYLEKMGYKVKTVEFIGVEHTPKNVMLIAEKSRPNATAASSIHELKVQFGIIEHYLDAYL